MSDFADLNYIFDTHVANNLLNDTYVTLEGPRGDTQRQGVAYEQRTVSISPPSLASAKQVAPSAAARTKLLLEGPILTTLLRLAAPNILNLLAFAGVITFDGFFSAASEPMRSPAPRWRFPG